MKNGGLSSAPFFILEPLLGKIRKLIGVFQADKSASGRIESIEKYGKIPMLKISQK